MLFSRLLWWIFGSSTSGPMRRMLEVMTAMPRSLSNTGGFHSASTHQSAAGGVQAVHAAGDLFRRGSASGARACRASCHWRAGCRPGLADGGIVRHAREGQAWAGRRRSRWRRASARLSGYTRRPSQTASPPRTTLSNTEIFAWPWGNRSPFTCTWMSALRGSNF